MDDFQKRGGARADNWQDHYEEQRRAELGRAAAALALENAERARQAAADAASAKRSAHEQGNLGFGYRSN